ncbi:MAG: class-II aminoacyl-tRNA synthetase family protein [Acidiferrobacter sp.]
METLAIPLPADLPVDICTEITKRACYCDTSIVKSRYRADSNSLEIDLKGSGASGDVALKLERLIGKMQGERLAVIPKVLRERVRHHGTFSADTYEQLVSRGDIWACGPGAVARSGAFLRLFNRLDGMLERVAVRQFQAKSHSYNALVPSDWLRRAGYFGAFAHSVTFAVHLNEDYDALERFSERHRQGESPVFQELGEIAAPENCLSPAVCYHTYGALMDQKLPAGGASVYTGQGRCFRYESKNLTGLDRLWEFSMREIVWLGERSEVLAAREAAMDMAWKLVEALDLSARLETACDPFFANDFPSLRLFQLANDLKYELLVDVTPDHTIACASFNYHERFFGTRFGIRTGNDEAAHTVCAAFGLERLLYACFCQHGLERAEELVENAVLRM